jgi:WD40 repeat protein
LAISGRGGASLAYSTDGRLVATADADLRLWDPATGRELRTLGAQAPAPGAAAAFAGVPVELARPTGIAFSPDGKSIASMNATQIAIWDTATGKQITAWQLTGPVRVMSGNIGLAYTTDGKALVGIVYNFNLQAARAAAAAAGGAPAAFTRGMVLNFWDAATGKDLRQIPIADVSSIPNTALVMSPDGRTLAASVGGQSIQIIELATGKVREELTTERPMGRGRGGRASAGGGPRDAHSLRFAPDGRTLYTVGGEGEVVAHDLVTGEERRFGAAQAGSPIHVSADGKLLATRGGDGGVRVYDTATGRLRQRVGDASPIARVNMAPFALSPDGATLAMHDTLGVRFIDVATGRDRGSSAGHTVPVTGVQFTPDGRSLISIGSDQVITWDVARRAVVATRPADEDRVRVRTLSADGKSMAESLYDGRLRVIEVATNRVRDFEAGKRLSSLAFAPDGKTLVAAEYASVQLDHEPRPIRRWDVPTGQPQPPLAPGAVPTQRLYFSADGRRLAGIDTTGGARVWEWPSGRLIWQAPPRAGATLGTGSAAFSPDGRKLVVATGQGPIRVFDATTGEMSGELEGHGGLTQAVAFAPDGRTAATGGTDGLVRIWDVENGSSLHHMGGHSANVTSLTYSSDGALLASGGADASIILWDATKLGRPEPKAAPRAPVLTADQVTKYWGDLAAMDAKVAYKAVRALAASPAASVPRLRELLSPVPPPEEARVAELLADLDHNQYARRQKASEALAALGPAVKSALRQHRTTAPAEARQRIDELLKRLDQSEWTPEMLRQVRAVEALERASTPEARAVLKKLGQGAADALLTREAGAALQRMK